jgi:hypothetical protein
MIGYLFRNVNISIIKLRVWADRWGLDDDGVLVRPTGICAQLS